MRVLYVNHTARVSGAERSLLELMTALRGDVDPVLACPEGDLSRRAEAAGLRTVRLHSLESALGRARVKCCSGRKARPHCGTDRFAFPQARGRRRSCGVNARRASLPGSLR